MYGQGFHYYRPMPVEIFEPLLAEEQNVDFKGIQAKRIQQMHIRDLFREDMASESMLNNILGPVAFYDVHDGLLELVKVNEHYCNMVGYTPMEMEENRKQILGFINEEDRLIAMDLFERAKRNPVKGAVGVMRRICQDGRMIWIRVQAFYLREQDGHRLYYCSITDVTMEKEKERQLEEANRVLQRQNEELYFLSNDMPGGYHICRGDRNLTFTYISNRFAQIFGYSAEEIGIEFDNQFINMVHPQDRELIYHAMERPRKEEMDNLKYRMQAKRGYIWVIDQTGRFKKMGRPCIREQCWVSMRKFSCGVSWNMQRRNKK